MAWYPFQSDSFQYGVMPQAYSAQRLNEGERIIGKKNQEEEAQTRKALSAQGTIAATPVPQENQRQALYLEIKKTLETSKDLVAFRADAKKVGMSIDEFAQFLSGFGKEPFHLRITKADFDSTEMRHNIVAKFIGGELYKNGEKTGIVVEGHLSTLMGVIEKEFPALLIPLTPTDKAFIQISEDFINKKGDNGKTKQEDFDEGGSGLRVVPKELAGYIDISRNVSGTEIEARIAASASLQKRLGIEATPAPVVPAAPEIKPRDEGDAAPAPKPAVPAARATAASALSLESIIKQNQATMSKLLLSMENAGPDDFTTIYNALNSIEALDRDTRTQFIRENPSMRKADLDAAMKEFWAGIPLPSNPVFRDAFSGGFSAGISDEKIFRHLSGVMLLQQLNSTLKAGINGIGDAQTLTFGITEDLAGILARARVPQGTINQVNLQIRNKIGEMLTPSVLFAHGSTGPDASTIKQISDEIQTIIEANLADPAFNSVRGEAVSAANRVINERLGFASTTDTMLARILPIQDELSRKGVLESAAWALYGENAKALDPILASLNLKTDGTAAGKVLALSDYIMANAAELRGNWRQFSATYPNSAATIFTANTSLYVSDELWAKLKLPAAYNTGRRDNFDAAMMLSFATLRSHSAGSQFLSQVEDKQLRQFVDALASMHPYMGNFVLGRPELMRNLISNTSNVDDAIGKFGAGIGEMNNFYSTMPAFARASVLDKYVLGWIAIASKGDLYQTIESDALNQNLKRLGQIGINDPRDVTMRQYGTPAGSFYGDFMARLGPGALFFSDFEVFGRNGAQAYTDLQYATNRNEVEMDRFLFSRPGVSIERGYWSAPRLGLLTNYSTYFQDMAELSRTLRGTYFGVGTEVARYSSTVQYSGKKDSEQGDLSGSAQGTRGESIYVGGGAKWETQRDKKGKPLGNDDAQSGRLGVSNLSISRALTPEELAKLSASSAATASAAASAASASATAFSKEVLSFKNVFVDWLAHQKTVTLLDLNSIPRELRNYDENLLMSAEIALRGARLIIMPSFKNFTHKEQFEGAGKRTTADLSDRYHAYLFVDNVGYHRIQLTDKQRASLNEDFAKAKVRVDSEGALEHLYNETYLQLGSTGGMVTGGWERYRERDKITESDTGGYRHGWYAGFQTPAISMDDLKVQAAGLKAKTIEGETVTSGGALFRSLSQSTLAYAHVFEIKMPIYAINTNLYGSIGRSYFGARGFYFGEQKARDAEAALMEDMSMASGTFQIIDKLKVRGFGGKSSNTSSNKYMLGGLNVETPEVGFGGFMTFLEDKQTKKAMPVEMLVGAGANTVLLGLPVTGQASYYRSTNKRALGEVPETNVEVGGGAVTLGSSKGYSLNATAYFNANAKSMLSMPRTQIQGLQDSMVGFNKNLERDFKYFDPISPDYDYNRAIGLAEQWSRTMLGWHSLAANYLVTDDLIGSYRPMELGFSLVTPGGNVYKAISSQMLFRNEEGKLETGRLWGGFASIGTGDSSNLAFFFEGRPKFEGGLTRQDFSTAGIKFNDPNSVSAAFVYRDIMGQGAAQFQAYWKDRVGASFQLGPMATSDGKPTHARATLYVSSPLNAQGKRPISAIFDWSRQRAEYQKMGMTTFTNYGVTGNLQAAENIKIMAGLTHQAIDPALAYVPNINSTTGSLDAFFNTSKNSWLGVGASMTNVKVTGVDGNFPWKYFRLSFGANF